MSTPVLVAVLTLGGTVMAAFIAFLGVVWLGRRNARAAEAKAEADERATKEATQVDGRRVNLSEYESLNRALRLEIDRLREDYGEDRQQLLSQIADLRAEVRWLRGDRADQIRRDRVHSDWNQEIVRWANNWLPQARAAGLQIPDPPPAPDLPPLIDPDRMDRPDPPS